MYTACLFDLDGTLTDPREGILNSVRSALILEGFSAPPIEGLEWVIGPPLRESFATLANLQVADIQIEQLMTRYRERFAPIGLYENHVFSDIPNVLESIRSRGIHCFVATSKPTVYAKKIINHFQLDRHFDRVLGSELDGSREDKQEIIHELLSEFHLQADQTLMVGDRKFDILGAKANGLNAIGVLYGFGSKAELTAAGALHLAEKPLDILNYII